jgi:hypothetical protein
MEEEEVTGINTTKDKGHFYEYMICSSILRIYNIKGKYLD